MMPRIGLTAGFLAVALLLMAGAAAAQDAIIETGTDGLVIADDIEAYNGSIGPGSPLYGLKIAFEDLDESFTFNETERLNKQMTNARLRLSEVKRELVLNNTVTADRALDLYGQKVNITQMRLAVLSSSNATGLLHAQEMITKHQSVLFNLLLLHPNNTGLARAYNNSLALERKFEEKTQVRFERIRGKNNQTILQAVRLAVRQQEHAANVGEDSAVRTQQKQKVHETGGNGKDNGKGNRTTPVPDGTLTRAGETPATVGVTAGPDDKGNDRNTGNHNSRQGNGKDT